MILLWGIPADEPLMAVHGALSRRGAKVAFLDQRAFLDTQVELEVEYGALGRLRVGEDALDLEEVKAVYLRTYDSLRMPVVLAAGTASKEAAHALSLEDILISWLDLTRAFVVSRPAAMASNGSKPYQAALIKAAGFAVPATLITTDPDAARAFLEEHRHVIYKSISSVRSIVSRLRADEIERLTDVVWCPTQFQEFVPGTDVRVHVVGEELFACEIVTDADDYRYAALQGKEARVQPCRLPADVVMRCCQLAADLELPVAGIDLRRTPEEGWYCFEVNPSPGFTVFQASTGLPIDEAIADLLLAPHGADTTFR